MRRCAAAAENMAVVANSCAGDAEIDPSAEISTRRMKVLTSKDTQYKYMENINPLETSEGKIDATKENVIRDREPI